MTVCHPKRKHYAKGQCVRCWRRDYYGTPEWQQKKAQWQSSSYRAHRTFHLEKSKLYHVWKAYGIDLGDYFALLAEGCQICGNQAMVIDHSHKTGKVRGGLCKQCNTGLGMFRDNPKLLKRAGAYLGL